MKSLLALPLVASLSLLGGAAVSSTTACNTPVPVSPTNLIAPGIACAESVLLDLAGVSDPAAVVAQCIQFGQVAVSDVMALAQILLAQLFGPNDAGVQGVGLVQLTPKGNTALLTRLQSFVSYVPPSSK